MKTAWENDDRLANDDDGPGDDDDAVCFLALLVRKSLGFINCHHKYLGFMGLRTLLAFRSHKKRANGQRPSSNGEQSRKALRMDSRTYLAN